MKKSYVYLIALAFASVGNAQAGGFVETTTTKDSPTFMVGITMELGEKSTSADVGLTAKVVSSNHEDKFVIGAGVSYFPWTKDPAGQVGLDISAGYNFTNITAMGGYDILRFKPQLSLGYTPTKARKVYGGKIY